MSRGPGGLDLSLPVLAAPMAGGPSGPELVIAAAQTGSIGFLAGGYKTREALAAQIAEVRSTGVPFGVNLFAPGPVPVDPVAFRRYARELQPEADRFGLDLSAAAVVEDDDGWTEKVARLLDDPVPVVSFTFAAPSAATVTALRGAGTLVIQTVTSTAEARGAADLGVDVLAVQSAEAGGHWGTYTPDAPPPTLDLVDLVAAVTNAVSLPVVAAGGLSTPGAVAGAIRAGAVAAMVGTALLLADESATNATHRAALLDPARTDTVVTRAFTGRPARGLRNHFTDGYSTIAPTGYPAIHHLTSGLRSAAATAGDAERLHLWAGTGHRDIRPGSTASILTDLAASL